MIDTIKKLLGIRNKRKVTRWANMYPGHIIYGIYSSKKEADKHAYKDGSSSIRIACVKLTGEYEVKIQK